MHTSTRVPASRSRARPQPAAATTSTPLTLPPHAHPLHLHHLVCTRARARHLLNRAASDSFLHDHQAAALSAASAAQRKHTTTTAIIMRLATLALAAALLLAGGAARAAAVDIYHPYKDPAFASPLSTPSGGATKSVMNTNVVLRGVVDSAGAPPTVFNAPGNATAPVEVIGRADGEGSVTRSCQHNTQAEQRNKRRSQTNHTRRSTPAASTRSSRRRSTGGRSGAAGARPRSRSGPTASAPCTARYRCRRRPT